MFLSGMNQVIATTKKRIPETLVLINAKIRATVYSMSDIMLFFFRPENAFSNFSGFLAFFSRCSPKILYAMPQSNNSNAYTATGCGAKCDSPIQSVATGMSDNQNNRKILLHKMGVFTLLIVCTRW